MSEGLSVAIITKNEERHLARALDSVEFADEVIVVDSGSTDSTLHIARSRGCRVIERDWTGFAPQKNFALEQASREWVLSLDADEALSATLAREVRQVVSGASSGCDACSVPRLTLFIDRWMRHGGWYPDRQIRLIRSGAAQFTDRRVHESIVTDRPVAKLRGDLLHYSYASVEDYVARMNSYSTLAAEEALARDRRVSSLNLATALPRKFLEVYVYKQGFLDGRHGFVAAWLSAYGVFLRYAKIRWPEPPA